MPREQRWSELIPGLLAAGGVVAIVLGILLFARVGALRGDTALIYTVAEQARGVISGTEVWMAGQKVGLVKDIRFRPPSTDTLRRVLLELEVLEKYLPNIRRDSEVQIRPGGTLIGAQVVHLSPGTSRAPPVQPRDTLEAAPQGDTEQVTSQIAIASRQFPAIIENVRTLNEQLRSTTGTLGALGAEEGMREFEVLRGRAGTIARDAKRGTIGLAMRDSMLVLRGRRALAAVDSVRQLLGSPETSLGRFRRDSTLALAVADLRNEISIARGLLARAEGTAGRALHDDIIAQQLARAEEQLAALLEDMKRRPLRYIHF